MSKTVIGLLDLDPLVYACAFAAQHKRYLIKDENDLIQVDFEVKQVASKDWRAYTKYDKDAVSLATAYSRKELLKVMEKKFDAASLEEYIDVEPLANACNMARETIKSVIKHSDCTHFQGVLSRGQCFRHQIATIQEYKGNRRDTAKPVYYQEMRDYFVNQWGALINDYYEADDYLAIQAHTCPDTTVIASIDKDLLTVPGWHYIHNKAPDERLFETTFEESMTALMGQLLTGDKADNIPGIKGIGPKTRDKILSGETLQEKWEAVVEKYQKHYGDEYTYPHWMKVRREELEKMEERTEAQEEEYITLCENSLSEKDCTASWKEILTEVGQLLWMVRDPKEPMWKPEWFEELIGVQKDEEESTSESKE